jgi:hypothetical protein
MVVPGSAPTDSKVPVQHEAPAAPPLPSRLSRSTTPSSREFRGDGGNDDRDKIRISRCIEVDPLAQSSKPAEEPVQALRDRRSYESADFRDQARTLGFRKIRKRAPGRTAGSQEDSGSCYRLRGIHGIPGRGPSAGHPRWREHHGPRRRPERPPCQLGRADRARDWLRSALIFRG